MRWNGVRLFALAFAALIAGGQHAAYAQCPALPNQLTNGQVADAAQVMANFSQLLDCLNAGDLTVPPVSALEVQGQGGGIATIQYPSGTANYSFNLPDGAGTAGQLLTSGGGGASAGTWTSIGAGLSLSGGALDLAPTTVTPGSYSLTNLTVDAKGRVTSAANGPSTGSSGHALPFLDGNNAWSGTQSFGPVIGTVTIQTGTSYVLGANDCGTTILFTNASPITVTTISGMAVGCSIAIEQGGTGQVTIVAGSGATQHSAHNFTKTYGRYSILGLFTDTNVGGTAADFIITGDGA